MARIRRAVPLGTALALFVTGLGALTAGPVSAVPADQLVYALTDNNEIVTFTAATPGAVGAPTAVNVPGGESIVAIDVRPATGDLYALTDASKLYIVEPSSGTTTPVGDAFEVALSGQAFGFDFNPVVDRIRIVSNTDQNLRVNPDTGDVVDGDTVAAGTQPDGTLAYEAADDNAGEDPAIVAAAYTNNTVGAPSTTLFGIDVRVDAADPEQLVTIGSPGGAPESPNGGKVFTVGALGHVSDDTAALDIAADGASYAAVRPIAGGSSSIYVVDTATGAAFTLGVIGVPGGVADIAVALPDPVLRLSGASRVETAVAASQNRFVGEGDTGGVVLARSNDFPDALAGVPLAVAKDAPLLLTAPDSLDAATKTEIDRVLAPGDTVYVLGGEVAVSAAVETALEAAGYVVVRFGGATRFDTAVQIASQGLANPGTVLLATGRNFPDALSGGAAAAKAGAAILLTDDAVLPAATNSYLLANPASTRFALGGQAAAAAPAATALAGADRFETSVLVAEEFFPGDGEPAVAGFASGRAFPDGLSGGAHIASAASPGPLLLTEPASVPAPVLEYLETKKAQIGNGFLYGGINAVQDVTLAALKAAIS
ncbi:MAG: DUF4394 domain-containing protein [Acidimicrobiia bacterium]